MARRHKFSKRVWQLESLERRCLMAADMEVTICPLPWATDDLTLTSAVFVSDPVSDEQVQLVRFQPDEPGQLTSEPAPYQWDVTGNDAFTSKVNASIERMGNERPEMQSAFIVALQIASVGPEFIDTEAKLDALYNHFLSQDSSGQGSPAPQDTQTFSGSRFEDDPIGARLLKTVRNDNWVAGVTSQREVVYRKMDDTQWHVLDQFGATRMFPEVYPAGDRPVVRYAIATDDPWVSEGKQAVIDMTTGEVTSNDDAPMVSLNYRDKANENWVVGGTPMGLIAYPSGANEGQSLDFLPTNINFVRSEFTDSANIVLLHGLTLDKPLEYRTVTVDLLNRLIVSDEVTDQPGAGFLAERAGDTFNILWNMDEPVFFNGQPDDIVRRTPEIPFGYFELPDFMYELPGMRHVDFPHRELTLEWSIESIAIHQFPSEGPTAQPLDYEIGVVIQVPGGAPKHQLFRATILDYAQAQAALKDINDYLESSGQSLSPSSVANMQVPALQAPAVESSLQNRISFDNSVDVNTIPGTAGQIGYIESMLREIDLRLKKTQMQFGVTKI